MRNRFLSLLLVLCCALLSVPHAFAGRPCETRRPSVASITQGLQLAERTLAALEASGSDVAVLARAGQDLGKYGQRYSHIAFAYRQIDAQGNPVWRVVHKLNQCGTAEAALYRQGLGEFFLDDPWRYEAAFVPLQPAVQRRLLPLLQNDRALGTLHERHYSMVSYAWGRRYQQSNQWVIETLALGMAGTDTREAAQQWLKAAGYVPTVLHIDAMTRLGGRLTAANVAFDDHPLGERMADRIRTVTADSVLKWLERSGLGTEQRVVR
ncbi:DUF2145 domain-containing protein [Noviherbaspirillum galbum]|uniref:DUF2145 domain-containing protein n=1 Tax=Noviherbaspirillum galbum TaxID=2709383 RepID=A0A6B3SK14_9BURK|nr:DUF2145 domain-containing protein [Noviherbaspirillum galbum]NEX61194.1 DUF2145 domain-containing protein [Noviherbaspirillum galbum]